MRRAAVRGDARVRGGVLMEIGAPRAQSVLVIGFAQITEAGLAIAESCVAACLVVGLHQKGVVAKT